MRIFSNGYVAINNGLAIYGSGLNITPYGSNPGQTISMSDDLTSALSVSDDIQSDYTFQLYSNGSTLINLASPPGSNAPNWGVGFRINLIDSHTGKIGGNLFNVTPWGSVGIGISNPASIPYKMLTVNGDASLANYNAVGGNGTNGFNGIEIIGAGKVPARRGFATGDDPSGDLNFFINSSQAAAAFHFKNGTTPNYQNYATSAAAPDLMRLDAWGSLTINGTVSVNGGLPNTKLLMGSANGAALNYGTSYIGLNAQRDPATGAWKRYSDGINTGGGILFGDVAGTITFSPMPSVTGSADVAFTDGDVMTSRTLRVGWNNNIPGSYKGQVVIGNQVPGNMTYNTALLTVSGTLIAKEIWVLDQGTANWADYVFRNSYKLMPLSEVEQYIRRNQRLPNVPTAEDIGTKGHNLSELQVKQMEKIEELTLYMIALNKKVDALKEENDKLKQELGLDKSRKTLK
jgi:hypothetical protein